MFEMKTKQILLALACPVLIISALCAGPACAGAEYSQGQVKGVADQSRKPAVPKNWLEEKSIYKQLIAVDPNRWDYYQGLGNAQLNLGEYQDAIRSYEKGIGLAKKIIANQNVSNPGKAEAKKGLGQMLTQSGNSCLKLRRNREALDYYEKAAEISPNLSIAYFNICATYYNLGDMKGAEGACKKSIAVDPGRADAHYILGSALFVQGGFKDNKYTAPPGTAASLKKYLELAPEGKFAKDVNEMLKMIE